MMFLSCSVVVLRCSVVVTKNLLVSHSLSGYTANPSVEQVHVCKRGTVWFTFLNVDLLSSTLVTVVLLSSTSLNVEQICSTLG